MSSRAEPLLVAPARARWWAEEWVRLTAFAYRNLIMARRNVFFLFELTFWPGVAMISHGLLTRFLDLTPAMTAFILVGTIALSAVQVCQLDVAYAVLFDIWSKSMKHQFLTPVRIHHLALGSWLVGVGRGVIVWALMALIGDLGGRDREGPVLHRRLDPPNPLGIDGRAGRQRLGRRGARRGLRRGGLARHCFDRRRLGDARDGVEQDVAHLPAIRSH